MVKIEAAQNLSNLEFDEHKTYLKMQNTSKTLPVMDGSIGFRFGGFSFEGASCSAMPALVLALSYKVGMTTPALLVSLSLSVVSVDLLMWTRFVFMNFCFWPYIFFQLVFSQTVLIFCLSVSVSEPLSADGLSASCLMHSSPAHSLGQHQPQDFITQNSWAANGCLFQSQSLY